MKTTKNKLELVPASALKLLGEAFTYGNSKYEGQDNWREGADWSEIIGSIKRKITQIEEGEDYDKVSGLLNVSHLLANCAILGENYRLFPERDNRNHRYLTDKKIGLDIDEVLAGFTEAYLSRYNMTQEVFNWNFDYIMKERLEELKEDKDFWLNLKPITDSIPFDPVCYITARNIPSEWTEQWLMANNFPCKPVITVGLGNSKVNAFRESNLDIFVDDSFSNFVELNKNKCCTFLKDAPHNRKYDVGYKRVSNLSDIC